MNNFSDMLSKAKDMQNKMKEAQDQIKKIEVEGVSGGNPAFDVTPNRLVTGLITERGVSDASEKALAKMFPDLAGF